LVRAELASARYASSVKDDRTPKRNPSVSGEGHIADMLHLGLHPFPNEIEDLIRKLLTMERGLDTLVQLPTHDWASGMGIDTALQQLQEAIRRLPLEGKYFVEELILGSVSDEARPSIRGLTDEVRRLKET
jgi:hypothetical protein